MIARFLDALEPAGRIGLWLVLLLFAAGLFAPLLLPADAWVTDTSATMLPPSAAHWFGTDNLGRDILSGILLGARTALMVGVLSVVFASVAGVLVGGIGGYVGGWVDGLLDRLTQLFIIIPRLFLAMALLALFGTSIWIVILTIGLVSWPQVARLTRIEFRRLARMEFIEAAHAAGAGHLRILFRHLLPNTLPVLIANASLLMSSAILLEAGLSFFGLSDPAVTSWGTMLSKAQDFLLISFWMPFFPGVAISLTGLGLNLFGDGLTRALSPRLRSGAPRPAKPSKFAAGLSRLAARKAR